MLQIKKKLEEGKSRTTIKNGRTTKDNLDNTVY